MDDIRSCTNRTLRAKVAINAFIQQVQMLPLLWRSTCDEVLEDVEVPLARQCTRNPVSLQVIIESLDTAKTSSI
jgi:hypothetical protein